MNQYDNTAPLKDALLQQDGSVTNLAGTVTYAGPDELRATQYANMAATASKVLMPDGSTVTLAEALMPAIGFKVEVVSELPEAGESGVIYLVGEASPYEEYIWLTDSEAYESLGSTEVDLTGYARLSTTTGSVNHGDDPTVPRPAGYAQILWTGSVKPDGMIDGDLFLDTTKVG
jgi:hypothetical protein